MQTLVPFLVFCRDQHGNAEEAMQEYCAILAGSRIVSIDRSGPHDAQPEGTVRVAEFELGRHPVEAIDNAAAHAFTFTPAISLWIDCSSCDELERAAASLARGGTMPMDVGDDGFSDLFCWLADRFRVTWQSNLPRAG